MPVKRLMPLLFVVFMCSCAGIGSHNSGGRISLHIAFGSGKAEILDASRNGGVSPPLDSGRTIRWEISRPDGLLLESGDVNDPRWHFWDSIGPDGKLHGGLTKTDSGLLIITVPAVRGMIRVLETDGAEIGRVDFDPAQWMGRSLEKPDAGSSKPAEHVPAPDVFR